MARKEPTPNYDLMFDSAVYALQIAYSNYKKCVAEELRLTWIDHDGNIGILDGYKERRLKTEEANREVTRLKVEVERLRELKGGNEND